VYRRPDMARRVLALLALAPVALACGSTAGNLTCPTTAQSLTFTAAGSCGGGAATGKVTISTQMGGDAGSFLCTLTVEGGPAVGLPSQGQFSGTASQTGYDLSKGNWYLFVSEGNSTEGSIDILCDESMSSSGVITLSCSGTNCPPDDCGGGGSCANIDCEEHLTPVN
jgi:hypothetical protein